MANEGEDAVRFVSELLRYCAPVGRTSVFVVLDNATRDNTRELLEAYARQEPRLNVVWAPENRCVVDAYKRGYREALASRADWILEIDAGFSHSPADIPKFFPLMLAGYDALFGSRFIKGGTIQNSSLKRRMVSWGGTQLTNMLVGTTLKDMTSGFEMFTRETLKMILERGIHSRAHFFQTEIKVHCRNLKTAEVPIVYEAASPGLSGGPITEAFEQLWRLFKLRLAGKLDAVPENPHAQTNQHRSDLHRPAEPRPAKHSSRVS
jgi:dolichol-phosphate mannosyltransferase